MTSFNPRTASFEELRKMMGEIIDHNPSSGKFWDLITCLRGPDSPSETPSMTSAESSAAYSGRRARKADTVEVIREKAFFGSVGGAARHRDDRDYVLLPPREEWDHFDKHVDRAARAIGLEVRIKGKEKGKWEVKCAEVKEAPLKIQQPSLGLGYLYNPDGTFSASWLKSQITYKAAVLVQLEEQYNQNPNLHLSQKIQNCKASIKNYEDLLMAQGIKTDLIPKDQSTQQGEQDANK